MIDENSKGSATKWAAAGGLVVLGLGLAAGGIYVGETDDAPGAALLGLLLMLGLVAFAVRIVRKG